MMHRRMAVIAEGDVAKVDLRGHASPHRQPDHGPQAGADRSRGGKPRHDGHAQDRPGRSLRRMRRGRTMAVGVTMMMMAVIVRGHLKMLYYNITSAKAALQGFPIAIAIAAARNGSGVETAARNHTNLAGMN